MTLEQFLKKIFGDKLNEEVDVTTDEKDSGDKNAPNNDDKDTNPPVTPTGKEKEPNVATSPTNILEDGWFNAESKTIDASKVKDPNVLSALNSLLGVVEQETTKTLIDKAINDELGKHKYSVNVDTVKKLIDTSNVKIEDGKVLGVMEAVHALKANEPTMFIDTSQQNNPLNQGFNPAGGVTTTTPTSFTEAIELMAESQ